jgi:fructose-1,6-bisphosphatase II / sedoheptulose-1,7-bisphosphatase
MRRPTIQGAEAAMSQSLSDDIAVAAGRVTALAAIAATWLVGRGDEKAADQAAVDAMRTALNAMAMSGRIVIGEGERDEAPMLYIGEEVGNGGPAIDIALDPLEGTTLTAKAMANALAVLAMAPRGGLLHAPDTYMDKIAIGPGFDAGLVDLDAPAGDNVVKLARAKGVKPDEIGVCVLDRPRHGAIIDSLRGVGARVHLISDGDVAGVIYTTDPMSGIDMYVGQGGAPEGVLAAAALKCVGGQFQGRLVFRNDDERARAERIGVTDFKRRYLLDELVSTECVFAATGVTDGALLKGVKIGDRSVKTHTLVMNSATRAVMEITAETPR